MMVLERAKAPMTVDGLISIETTQRVPHQLLYITSTINSCYNATFGLLPFPSKHFAFVSDTILIRCRCIVTPALEPTC